MSLLPSQLATYARHHEQEPRAVPGDSCPAWITRGANFAVVVSKGEAGAIFSGTAKDEQFVYALEGGISVSAGVEHETLDVEDLAILPPGAWTLRFDKPGHVVQLLTADEALAQQAPNAARYAGGAPEVAPIVPWPVWITTP